MYGGNGEADVQSRESRWKLKNVLEAVVKYDSQMGYIQGMNYWVASVLYHTEEYFGFWLIIYILEERGLKDCYLPGILY